MTDRKSLQKTVADILLPSKILAWLESLPQDELLKEEEGIDLLVRYLQQHTQKVTVTLSPLSIYVTEAGEEKEVPIQRNLRWFLLDYQENPSPLPAWKARYLLLKAVADDLRIRHENAS
jgi:hypothetical protein